MAMRTRPDLYPVSCGVDTHPDFSRKPASTARIGLSAPINKAVVGQNAAHEAGIHQHGVMANRATYEIMTPESIGLLQTAWCWASTAAATPWRNA